MTLTNKLSNIVSRVNEAFQLILNLQYYVGTKDEVSLLTITGRIKRLEEMTFGSASVRLFIDDSVVILGNIIQLSKAPEEGGMYIKIYDRSSGTPIEIAEIENEDFVVNTTDGEVTLVGECEDTFEGMYAKIIYMTREVGA